MAVLLGPERACDEAIRQPRQTDRDAQPILPREASLIEDLDADVFVRLQSDLLVIGDSIMTDRHHASNGNYDPDDPQNQIGGIIPAFPLSGWLRHGMESIVQQQGGTPCHPGEANANFMKDGIYERDLDAGYHEKGACTDDPNDDEGCVVFS